MSALPTFSISERYGLVNVDTEKNDLREYLRSSFRFSSKKLWRGDRKKHMYLNVPVSFDIETSSWLDGDKGYRACMYCFVFGFYGCTFLGRTWNDFEDYLRILREEINVGYDRRVIIYVHNLAYEFQFLQKRLEWDTVFAVDPRTPIKAITKDGFEFRDSYILSGYSLAKTGESLLRYPVRKMVGDLDYSLIRHSETQLTEKEWQYVIHDGQIVLAYIKEEMENNHDSIMTVPLTNTGKVRRYVRHQCYCDREGKKSASAYKKYRHLMNALTLEGPDEYVMLKEAFQGGFTHARSLMSNRTLEDVTSYDFTSSYPYSMISEYYPMSKGRRITIKTKEEFDEVLHRYCCLFRIRIHDLEYNGIGDVPISRSKCYVQGGRFDNGRIISAKLVETTMTEVDFAYIRKFYDWTGIQVVGDMFVYDRGYLPYPIVKAVLDLYQKKTTLKGVKGKEQEYQHAKGMLNSCYGMMVTDIVRDENVYEDGEWNKRHPEDMTEMISKYNTSKGRFLFYPWGVWVTAWSRRHLFEAIYTLNDDYIYADTDSVKLLNIEKHQSFFDGYNRRVEDKLREAMEFHRIDFSLCHPKTVKGEEKMIGVFDFDGHFKRFKTLGAKRYIKEDDNGEIEITVSGVSKMRGVDYLRWKYKDPVSIFEHFAEGLEFPATYDDHHVIKEGCGKKLHVYDDERISGYVTDYQGNKGYYDEKSFIYMAPTSYNMTMTAEYIDLILNIQKRRTYL